MPIQLSCPGCSKQFRVADEHAGKKVKCPTCSTIFQVPEAVDQSPYMKRPLPRDSAVGGSEPSAFEQASPYQPSQYAAAAYHPPDPPSEEQRMGQISIGLGIAALVGEFVLPFFLLCCCGALGLFVPAAMAVPSGIGLALAFKASEGTKMAGIILNSIALAVSVLAIIGLIAVFGMYGVMIFQSQQ